MQPSHRRSRIEGFSLIELLIVVAIIGLLMAAVIPEVMTARINASEVVVIREVQTIHQAQVQYLSQFGEYAASLAQLGPPQAGVPGPQAAKLIPASLSGGDKNGYRFTLAKTLGGFAAHADPKVFGKDGRRTFYIDEDGVVHQNWGPAPATAESPEIK